MLNGDSREDLKTNQLFILSQIKKIQMIKVKRLLIARQPGELQKIHLKDFDVSKSG